MDLKKLNVRELNTVEILVMKDGKIIEQGIHNELISKDSVYKSMWEKQSINLS